MLILFDCGLLSKSSLRFQVIRQQVCIEIFIQGVCMDDNFDAFQTITIYYFQSTVFARKFLLKD